MSNTELGRRSFIKGSAAVLAGTAVAGAMPQAALREAGAEEAAPAEEQVFQGVCRGNCGGGCKMNVHVRDGKVVKTSVIEQADPLDTRICQRGLGHAQRIYDADRIQYPMRRVEGTERGAGEWERLTWEEAIDYVGGKWRQYLDEDGSRSIHMMYGAGTYAYNQYVYQHLFYQFGGINWDAGYDMASLNMGKKVFGRGIYLHGNDCSDVKNAKYVFCWGNNSTVAQITRWAYLLEARKNGAKLIVINPTFNGVAEKADLWVPLKPGTDGALALGMLKVIIDEGLTDEKYLAKMSVAPYLVKADMSFLRMSDLGVAPAEGAPDPVVLIDAEGNVKAEGEVEFPVLTGVTEVEGIAVSTVYDLMVEHVAEWTPERTAEFCEIDDPQTIVELARMYAEGPTSMEIGFGVDHRSNGAAATQCMFTLPIFTGQMGKPGAGITGTMGGSTMGTHCVNFMAGLFTANPVYTVAIPVSDVPEMVATGQHCGIPMAPKSVLFFSGNPMTNMSGLTPLKEAMKDIELLVTCDTVMNDTARFSDVILPVPHWFEYETFITCPTPYALFQDECVPPAFECKTDIEICKLLAERMGLDASAYQSDRAYQELFLTGAAAEAWGLTWDRMKEEKAVLVCPIPYMYASIDDPTFKFGSATGRAEFYFEKPRPLMDFGQEFDPTPWYLPTQQDTTEAYNPANPLFEKYEFNLITQRDRLKVHSQFATHPWYAEIQPEPTLSINPVDAEAKGIAEDDYVKLYNDRGYVVLRAHMDAAVRPGMLITEHTWWDKQYVDGSYGSLLPIESAKFCPGNHPFDALVNIEKVTA